MRFTPDLELTCFHSGEILTNNDLRDGPVGAGFSGELSFMLYPQRPGAPGLLKQPPRLPLRCAAVKMEQVGAATSGDKEPKVSTFSIC